MSTDLATVLGVASDAEHRFSKVTRDSITLVAGWGVVGDAHAGAVVQHRSRVAADPSQSNLRQVHLLQSDFHALAAEHGYALGVGDLGENVLTQGLDLLGLPRDTHLHIGEVAVVRVTGLRNPCWQIDDFRQGLLKLAVGRGDDGEVVRRAGVMGVVVVSGTVAPGDPIRVVLPPEPYQRLERV